MPRCARVLSAKTELPVNSASQPQQKSRTDYACDQGNDAQLSPTELPIIENYEFTLRKTDGPARLRQVLAVIACRIQIAHCVPHSGTRLPICQVGSRMLSSVGHDFLRQFCAAIVFIKQTIQVAHWQF